MERLGVTGSRYPNAYIPVFDNPKVEISIWIGRDKSGIYVRRGRGEPVEPVVDVLERHRASLEAALDAPLDPSGRKQHFLSNWLNKGHDQREAWPEIMTWMHERVADYRAALEPILKGETA